MAAKARPGVGWRLEETHQDTGASARVKRIVLLGQTGSGKSSLGNVILRKETVFQEGFGTDSCTGEAVEVEGMWQDEEGGCVVIDTPGMDDSDNRDTEHIKNIIDLLKKGEYVNTFVLVRNGQNQRMSNSFRSMLTIFELMFGKGFWDHVIIDVSHVEYEKEANYAKDVTNWRDKIISLFPTAKSSKLPSVLIDVKDKKNQKSAENLKRMWKYVQKMPDFECKDFEERQTEMDAAKESLHEMKVAYELKQTEAKSLEKEIRDVKEELGKQRKREKEEEVLLRFALEEKIRILEEEKVREKEDEEARRKAKEELLQRQEEERAQEKRNQKTTVRKVRGFIRWLFLHA